MTNPTHYLVPAEPTFTRPMYAAMLAASQQGHQVMVVRSRRSGLNLAKVLNAVMRAASPHTGQVNRKKFGKICQAAGIDREKLMIVLKFLGLQVEETG